MAYRLQRTVDLETSRYSHLHAKQSQAGTQNRQYKHGRALSKLSLVAGNR